MADLTKVTMILSPLKVLGVGNEEGDAAHHDTELGEANLAVPVLVHGVNHLIDLLVGHLPREVHQDKLHLVSGDTAWRNMTITE